MFIFIEIFGIEETYLGQDSRQNPKVTPYCFFHQVINSDLLDTLQFFKFIDDFLSLEINKLAGLSISLKNYRLLYNFHLRRSRTKRQQTDK